MRRRILFIFALPIFLAGLVMAAPAALAVSPHFINERDGELRRVPHRQFQGGRARHQPAHQLHGRRTGHRHLGLRQQGRREPQRPEQDHRQRPGEQDRGVQLR